MTFKNFVHADSLLGIFSARANSKIRRFFSKHQKRSFCSCTMTSARPKFSGPHFSYSSAPGNTQSKPPDGSLLKICNPTAPFELRSETKTTWVLSEAAHVRVAYLPDLALRYLSRTPFVEFRSADVVCGALTRAHVAEKAFRVCVTSDWHDMGKACFAEA
jgi:hypothetical protein